MSVTQINPKEAFELLKNDKNSALIDVRTFEEFTFVGLVDAASFDGRLILLPWQIFPEMQENPEFGSSLDDSLEKIFPNNTKETKLFFICRTGGRSNSAATYASNLGYKNSYNITSGFEGDLNSSSQRGKVSGWKFENLPWRQK